MGGDLRDDDTMQGDGRTVDSHDPDRPQMALTLVYRDGIQVVPLSIGVPVTLGREEPSDIRAHSRRLSRVHARFEWDGVAVRVEDLGSTNGTFLNGDRIDSRAMIGANDEVMAGSVVVTVHEAGTLPATLHGVERHEAFLEAVDREIARARTFGRGLSVLLIRAAGGRAMLARWVPRVQGALRVVDRIGLFTPGSVEVLLAEADTQEARRLGASLVTNRDEGEPPLLVGVATYPQHGSSGESLVSAASEAVAQATLTNPVVPHRYPVEQSIDDGGGPVIRNPRMVDIWRALERVASSAISILIVGETGSGKEIVARAIHDRSPRRDGPMRNINCGAIPSTLIESLLFGHERGAFTGADTQRAGVFEEASGGTVLLDEIGELSLAAQVALLRVLEDRTITRVGGRQEIEVDVRVLAATHRDLEAMCRSGGFRWDLYYRLNAYTIQVPPLRERADEIRPLVRRFVDEANRIHDRQIVGVTPEALALLESHSWPGNVRELRNAVERGVVVAIGDYLTVEDLPDNLRTADEGARRPLDELDDEEPTDSGIPGSDEGSTILPLKLSTRRLERRLLCAALSACDGNQTRAAELLQMSRRTLVYKLKGFGIGEEWHRSSPLAPLRDADGRPLGFSDRIALHEAEQIRRAIERTGDPAEAAVLLDIQRRTLQRKLEQVSKVRAEG